MAIRFDYNKTMQQAKLLEELAADMQTQAVKPLQEVAGNVEAAWTGDAGKAFNRYLTGVQGDLLRKAKYLKETAEFLRSAAKTMQQAEEQAKAASSKL